MRHSHLVCPLLIWCLSLMVSACSAQAPAPAPPADVVTKLPALKVQTVAVPVVTSRCFSSGLAPNGRGGWCWIGQFMNYMATGNKEKITVQLPTGQHYRAYKDVQIRPEAEWVVVDLETGRNRVFNWPGFHSPINPTLAGNGRLFFSVDYGHIYYYEPTDQSVKILGQVEDDLNVVRFFYKLITGPDGMIYGASQSTNGKATLMRLNPDTLEYKLIHDVGQSGRRELTYGYYLAVEPPWAYVAVGQGQWELWAVNMDTGEKKMLTERIVGGEKSRIVVQANPSGGCTATLSGEPGNESVALENGAIVARATEGQRFNYTPKPRSFPQVQWIKTKPLVAIAPIAEPELDTSRWSVPTIENDGSCTIKWRPSGDKGDWRPAKFSIKNAQPEGIESLTALADGSILGNVRQYNGWFRYYPNTGQYDYFGKSSPDGAQTVVVGDLVYFSGYPNVTLCVYDPAKPWQDGLTDKPGANPLKIGSQGQGRSEAHRSKAMATAGGRVYTLGERERWSTGTGICCYLPDKKEFIFLGQENKDLTPVAMIAMPKLQRIIVSGAKKDAQLLVYDLDLKEIQRITLKPGLENTGRLLAVNDTQFLGCYSEADGKKTVLYLYDLALNKLVKSVEVDGQINANHRPVDNTFWVFAEHGLCRLDVKSLTLAPVGKLERGMGLPVWQGKELYGRFGGELVKLSQPVP